MNGNLEKWIKSVDKRLDNHLHDVADEFKKITIDIASMKSDVRWITIMIIALFGALIVDKFIG